MGARPRIALLGSRGIPARYGGAETFAEEISYRLTGAGFEVYVSCQSRRFGKDVHNDVIRVHTPSVQGKTLTIPTVNEVLSSLHLLMRCRDVELVYYATSYSALAAMIPRLLGKKVVINTDGIEWKRPIRRRRYLSPVWKLLSILAARYLLVTERMAVKVADTVIADSRAIKTYLEERHHAKNAVFIPYGARELSSGARCGERGQEVLRGLDLSSGEYYLTIARIVAENNIDKEIKGFCKSASLKKLAIVGNFNDKDGYTKYLLKLRGGNTKIRFLDAIYDEEILGILRDNCFAYIHAYELGGTNPSLLEQMLFAKPILAYDVPFHREVLQAGGIYFASDDELTGYIERLEAGEFDVETMSECQRRRISEEYNWDSVAAKYEALFRKLLEATPD